MVLYKYLHAQHLDDFFRIGRIRIGTLHGYRDVEKLGALIADPNEGKFTERLSNPWGITVNMATDSDESRILRRVFVGGEKHGVEVTMHADSAIEIGGQISDLFVYCTSLQFSAEKMRELGYDACLRISDPKHFASVVSQRMRNQGVLIGSNKVTYGSRIKHYKGSLAAHPAMLKEPRFASEAEWRMLWETEKSPISALFVDVPKAIKYCRPHKW